MPTPNLSSYNNIQTALFVKIAVDSNSSIRFSDYNENFIISGESYTGYGQFVGITTSTSELKNSSGSITITISGIPNTNITGIMALGMKGSQVSVYRVFFDAATGSVLNISGNPAGRFFGVIDNYTIDEEYDNDDRISKNTISFNCKSVVELLDNKIAGRKTNPSSWRSFNSQDPSMDRVPNLIGANFDFGKPN
jgi:hypothetical protein